MWWPYWHDWCRPQVRSLFDPLYFIYQPPVGIDNAVKYLLHWSLSGHSLFNCAVFCLMFWWMIQEPHREQMRVLSCSYFPTDFQDTLESCFLPKFSGDSVIIWWIWARRDKEYRALVNNFVEWAEYNHLLLNVDKTRELMLHLSRNRTALQPLYILGMHGCLQQGCPYFLCL